MVSGSGARIARRASLADAALPWRAWRGLLGWVLGGLRRNLEIDLRFCLMASGAKLNSKI